MRSDTAKETRKRLGPLQAESQDARLAVFNGEMIRARNWMTLQRFLTPFSVLPVC
jgi:hypothetical protein